MPTEQEFQQLERKVHELESILKSFVGADRFYIRRDMQFPTNTGVRLGKTNKEMFAFWGKAPVDQPAAVADAVVSGTTGAGTVSVAVVDANFSSLATAVNAVIARLEEVGIIAT